MFAPVLVERAWVFTFFAFVLADGLESAIVPPDGSVDGSLSCWRT